MNTKIGLIWIKINLNLIYIEYHVKMIQVYYGGFQHYYCTIYVEVILCLLFKSADNPALNRSTEKQFKLVGGRQLIYIRFTGRINLYVKVSVCYIYNNSNVDYWNRQNMFDCWLTFEYTNFSN